MHYSITTVTPPASEPLSLADAKLHLRVDATDEDTLISSLITAARLWCESLAGRAFVTQTLAVRYDEFPDVIVLPRVPVASVTSIQYVDTAGTTQTLDASLYQVDIYSVPSRIAPAYGQSWPLTREQMSAVTVTFTAGVANTSVPADVVLAIKLLVGHWFVNREATGKDAGAVAFSVDALLAPYRIWL